MVELAISAAINIAVGLLLNTLFPPPDIEVTGPRLTDLGFTSAAYGRFVNIVFGTDRVDGNIIDTPDPAIEEVVTVESQSAGGKGGGQTVNTTTYTYFLTARISWCIEGATDIIRLWADGKLVGDASGGGVGLFALMRKLVAPGITLTFYPGGPAQPRDPEEVSRRDGNIPAYRHLTSIKLDRMPLANYGNRIPNFTAEIAFASIKSTPVLNMVEPTPDFELPGSIPGGDTTRMIFDPEANRLYSLKTLPFGLWAAEANTLRYVNVIGPDLVGFGVITSTVGRDGFAYRQTGAGNAGPLNKIDAQTGAVVATFGGTGSVLDDENNFGNSGSWWQLQANRAGAGSKSVVFHLNTSFGQSNGSVVDPDLISLPTGFITPVAHTFSTADGLPSNKFTGVGIPDHDRARFFLFIVNVAADTYELHKVIPNIGTGGPKGALISGATISLVRSFSRGSISGGDDFEGTGNPDGWAVNRGNGDLILSNRTSIILYNPDTNTLLANTALGNFRGQNNYYNGSIIAYGINDGTNGTIRVLDTRDLTIVNDIRTDDIPWPNSELDGHIHEPSCVWDDRTQALFLSRVEGVGAAQDFRILKVFVNRVNGQGVGLDTVVSALSTSYQRQTMAGLDASDIDVTTLAGDTVFGYTLNRQSTMKQALQPLRDRFLFDGVQSDWIMKFPKRGAIPSVTIPAVDVGTLKRGRDQSDDPAVREVRQDDLSLPMALTLRYRNKDIDYQIDAEHDKRHIFPDPTMRSKTEKTIDIPIVDIPVNMKPLTQKHLLTMWNERVAYKTVIPWTYIALDATDVFNMVTFNETAQLRMAEMDVGLGWAIEVTGVVEDTKSFTSTIGSGVGLGHVVQVVPSSLPTRLFALDAPILSISDFPDTVLSNAYMVVSAFEDNWGGAVVMRSLDNVDYSTVGTANVEAAIGRVITTPSHFGYNTLTDGDFPNRFQSVAEGGTITISALRRNDAWSSAADEVAVLAGANTIAVIHGDTGEVEILGFVDAALQTDLTIQLSNLIRGRLGTEDIADKDISVGDVVVLLSNAANEKEDGPILRQRLIPVSLNIAIFFKGVTIGTLIEDAPVISATYTGRDLKPFSVVHTTAVNSAGDIVVDWERRARGPLAAEWLDGTGEIVLNETIESYEAIITDGSSNSFTKTVSDATTLTFLAAEITALSGASTVTVTQEGESTKKSPITPSSTASVTV